MNGTNVDYSQVFGLKIWNLEPIDMDWNAEVNTFLRSLDEDSRYFDSELKVWKMTSEHLTDLTNVIEREGLLYKINYF